MIDRLEEEVEEFKPEEFLRSNSIVSENTLAILKSLYDFTKVEEKNSESLTKFLHSSTAKTHGKKKRSNKSTNGKFQLSRTELPLESLIVKSFDCDQVWEELQLQNSFIYETLISSVSKLLARSTRVANEFAHELESDDDISDSNSDGISARKISSHLVPHIQRDSDSGSDVEFEGARETTKSKVKNLKTKNQQQHKQPNRVYGKSVVDDKFFNLAQMIEFEDELEAKMDKRNENESQNSESESDDEEESQMSQNYFYKDYFDPPLGENIHKQRSNVDNAYDHEEDGENSIKDEPNHEDEDEESSKTVDKSVRFNLLDDEGDDEEENEIVKGIITENSSNFEKRRKKIEEGIELMEKEALEPKAWQFRGEITAEKRPENSLLEEHVIFDHLIRQAPEITAETTFKLEDIIKQRIKDQAWDDVIRKVKPVDNPVEYKKKLVLDSEKSRVGLSKIYEEEYLKQKKAEGGEKETEEIPENQIQIEKDLKVLFSKLDALSNFHYTPKPPSAEIRIVTNLPSITIEEVAPVSVSDATLLAPQEIQDPSQSEIKGKAERTDTDKKRERRVKKKKQKIKRIAREEKAQAKGFSLEHVTFADKKLKKQQAKSGENEGFQKSKELKSSRAFFSKLQQEAQSQIKGTLAGKRKKDSSQLEAKKFKL